MNNQSTSYSQYGGNGGGGLIVIRYEPQYAPAISSITPNSGPTAGGQAVTLNGSNFVSVTSANIGGAALTGLSVPSTTVINATTSAGGAGTYNVNVYRSGGPSPGVGANLYTYVAPPTLSSCNPPLGLIFGGMDVTLTGTLLTGVNSVTFGGTAATNVVVVNATTVTCKTPAHAAGLVNVVASNSYGSATLVNGFTYLLPASGFNMPMMGI
jgi:large repetitive protein